MPLGTALVMALMWTIVLRIILTMSVGESGRVLLWKYICKLSCTNQTPTLGWSLLLSIVSYKFPTSWILWRYPIDRRLMDIPGSTNSVLIDAALRRVKSCLVFDYWNRGYCRGSLSLPSRTNFHRVIRTYNGSTSFSEDFRVGKLQRNIASRKFAADLTGHEICISSH